MGLSSEIELTVLYLNPQNLGAFCMPVKLEVEIPERSAMKQRSRPSSVFPSSCNAFSSPAAGQLATRAWPSKEAHTGQEAGAKELRENAAILEGHGFSRAVIAGEFPRALAPEGIFLSACKTI
jgi:hypothetical protein